MTAPPFAVSDPLAHAVGNGFATGPFAPAGRPPISPTTPSHTSVKRTLSGSGDSLEDCDDSRKNRPGVKRACNECRQQKLRCDVVQVPVYKPCHRCKRLKLDCKIDSTFKRVGKRSRNMEMEKEIHELRRQLATQQSSSTAPSPSVKAPPSEAASPIISNIPSQLDQYLCTEQAGNSLLDLRSGIDGASQVRSPNGQSRQSRRLGGITLTPDQVDDLFERFFTLFHPFLPLLDPSITPDVYFDMSQLLPWIIISVAARHYPPDLNLLPSLAAPTSVRLWAALADVPQNYVVVKALCILCTWPLPVSSTSSDPTFMLSGLMMQIAMQIGLHRPSHAQDFARFKEDLREEELRDRVRTWVACNMISQRVATGYGQPPSTVYDWALVPSASSGTSYQLPEEVETRLSIERFCNKVTRSFYTNKMDPMGLVSDEQRGIMSDFLAHDFEEIECKLRPNTSAITFLYLRAAGLHFRLSAFFDSPESQDYRSHIASLWQSTTSFLERVFDMDTDGGLLPHSSNYILQMIIAAGFTLLKLLNSFFADSVKLAYGRDLFLKTIKAIRTISVATNDLPSRLAEVLAQLWKSGGSGLRAGHGQGISLENSLQLKVRCRMSMSLVYDSVWRWREEFQTKERGNLETAVENPTNPESNVESSASSTVDTALPSEGLLGDGFGTVSNNFFGEANNEVFDPLSWMLDGYTDFPYDM
ncbi:MAG: hypothetical protein LQ349_006772 [Xanthoria aureola]|nr:MAG: hypothetical protein LQ349_006772 [Xanthoria aureola]